MKKNNYKKFAVVALGIVFSGAVYAATECGPWYCQFMGPNPHCLCQVSQ